VSQAESSDARKTAIEAISPGLTDAAERRLGDGDLLEIRSDETAAVGAFGLDYARADGVDPDLLRAELVGQHAGDGVDRALSAGVNRAAWGCDAADEGANVDGSSSNPSRRSTRNRSRHLQTVAL
jgi:hypothetical protein